LLPHEAACILDPVLDRSAAHPILHEIRLLLRDAGDERRLRVRDDPHLVDSGRVDLRPRFLRIVVFRNREDPTQLLLELSRPHLRGGLEPFRHASVQSDRRDPHRRHLDDGHGDLDLLARGRRGRSVVDDNRVRHARLVSSESLEPGRATVNIRPAREMRYRALAALAGRKAHRSVSRSVFLRHSPLLRREWSLLAYDEPRAFGRDTVTLPARPEESGPHFRDPRRDCPGRLVDALGRPYGGAIYNSLEREGCASWGIRSRASWSSSSAAEGFRLRLGRLCDPEDERLDDRFVLFLVDRSFVLFRERSPECFHPRVVVFVTHRRAFADDMTWKIENLSPRARQVDAHHPWRARSDVSPVITLP